jgi:hypothetical protein
LGRDIQEKKLERPVERQYDGLSSRVDNVLSSKVDSFKLDRNDARQDSNYYQREKLETSFSQRPELNTSSYRDSYDNSFNKPESLNISLNENKGDSQFQYNKYTRDEGPKRVDTRTIDNNNTIFATFKTEDKLFSTGLNNYDNMQTPAHMMKSENDDRTVIRHYEIAKFNNKPLEVPPKEIGNTFLEPIRNQTGINNDFKGAEAYKRNAYGDGGLFPAHTSISNEISKDGNQTHVLINGEPVEISEDNIFGSDFIKSSKFVNASIHESNINSKNYGLTSNANNSFQKNTYSPNQPNKSDQPQWQIDQKIKLNDPFGPIKSNQHTDFIYDKGTLVGAQMNSLVYGASNSNQQTIPYSNQSRPDNRFAPEAAGFTRVQLSDSNPSKFITRCYIGVFLNKKYF